MVKLRIQVMTLFTIVRKIRSDIRQLRADVNELKKNKVNKI